MAATLTALLAGHFLGDFPLQLHWMAKRKRRFGVLLLHVAIVAAVTALLLGLPYAPVLFVALFAIHFALDAFKTYRLKDSLAAFVGDQALHVLSLLALAAWFDQAFASGWWALLLSEDHQHLLLAVFCAASGIVLALPAGGYLIAKAVKRFTPQLGALALHGLADGGKYIGYLERLLIGLLVAVNQLAGVGFLITAKSILRFAEIKDSRQRRLAEYVIIGTFMSFAWGLLVAILARAAWLYWLPEAPPVR